MGLLALQGKMLFPSILDNKLHKDRWLFSLSYFFFFSRAEQTSEYAPPEALLNSTWYQGPTGITLKYVILLLMFYLIMWDIHHFFQLFND